MSEKILNLATNLSDYRSKASELSEKTELLRRYL